MRLDEALEGVKRIFIDTAPVIYFVIERYIGLEHIDPDDLKN
ncbi:hypothetical protein [Coleofasciculus sp. E1-EBD-02]